MQNDTGWDTPELSCWTDAITEAIQRMYLLGGWKEPGDDLHLVVDVSRLLPKIEF